jgi:5-carboxymethyl-2-hydroxymuconate isomerase
VAVIFGQATKSTSLRLGCDSFRHHLRIFPSWRARIAETTKLEVNQPDKLVNQYLHFCLEIWSGRDEEIVKKVAMFCANVKANVNNITNLRW